MTDPLPIKISAIPVSTSTPVDADIFPIVTNISTTAVTKKVTWANIKATLNSVYAAIAAPIKETSGPTVLTTGAIADGEYLKRVGTTLVGAAAGSGSSINNIQNGRLTLESGVAVSTTDQADKVTLYFTPFIGNQASVYVGAAWTTLTFAELSLNITAYTASKLYDIWLYSNAGNLALDSTVWTNDTTRATALALQDGIYVKNGDATRKYVGTILMDAASKCQDKVTLRNVWNYYNRVGKSLYTKEPTGHTYNGAERLWNNSSTNNYLQFITGVNDEPVTFINWSSQKSADGSYAITRIKIDGNYFGGVVEYGQVENWNAQYLAGSAQASAYPGVGKHYVQIHETSNTASATFNIMVMSGTIKG